MKRGWPNFLGGTNSAERLNYLVPPSVFFFQIFGGPNSSSFISFHCILHVSVVFLFQFKKFGGPKLFFIHLIPLDSIWPSSIYLSFLKFPQIKEGGPNFFGRETNSTERLNYLAHAPYYIWILKVLRTQILYLFSFFYMSQLCF